jgi:hypothetical protein
MNPSVLRWLADENFPMPSFRFRPPGLVYFRLTDYLPHEPAQLLLVMQADNWPFVGNLCVVDNDATRIRPIPAGV